MSQCVYHKANLCKNRERCVAQVITKQGLACRQKGELSPEIEKESPGPSGRKR